MAFIAKILISILLFLFSFQLHAESIHGKVVGITDGDILTVLVNREPIKVRIAGIDASEKGQPFGNKAKTGLSNLVFGQNVRVEKEKLDRYGRTIGKVFIDDTVDVGGSLVAYGYAWVYRKYARDQALYDYEKIAKSKKLGIWALPNSQQVPPWEWRKQKRGINQTGMNSRKGFNENLEKPSINSSCGAKRYCNQMASCSKARFYLTQCGLDRMDSDKDSVPCKKLCG